VLLAKVRAQLRIKDIRDNLKIANQRLQDLVEIDDLTGLFNMRSIYQKIETELGRARRYGRAVGVVMMDMDNFKTVNDTNDHLFGSHVLSEVGKIIQKTIRQADFAARYGGDEFLIALAETTPDGAVAFAERLRSAIAAATFTSPHSNPPATMRLTASLGVAVYHAGSEPIDARSLVLNADHALYEAKHAGKDCIRVFDLKATDILAKRTS
jgi:diguanylate cyclase (GGDEF)-like protein